MNFAAFYFRLPRPVALMIVGLFMAIILFTSTKPTPEVHGLNTSFVNNILDYAHFPIYAFLTFLLMLAMCSFEYKRQIAAFVIAVSFGILNEIVQSSVPGRSCSLHDIIVNVLGAFLTIVLVNYFFRQKGIKK